MDLEQIAKKVRKDFETRSVSREKLRLICAVHFPEVRDIDKFLTECQLVFPHGNCGLTSAYMKSLIGIGRLLDGMYKSNDHTILYLGGRDKTMIDITADQFGGPEVYVGSFQYPWERLPQHTNQYKAWRSSLR